MRKLKNGKVETVICNRCGRMLKSEKGYIKEDFMHVEHVFGYFSKRDGTRQVYDLCEECCEEITAAFKVPAEESVENELL